VSGQRRQNAAVSGNSRRSFTYRTAAGSRLQFTPACGAVRNTNGRVQEAS